ncbi:PREDICTED: probable carboxylesterase [Prunus dulcis]|uniref:PREDICTED: probable carboxylesterase n=2 Tax=Prunus dulcis TaxID=3755 RepID=A0A5E4EQJ5_PRUDU|nr:probable carboxylesterase 6 [Prunus dulcis]KAI5353085.1 hypothetical protein L3X38_005977 [Prunus dulcis]VVA17933.1 PREDICTED: probable carboxylesterase [Prunus dulcis]
MRAKRSMAAITLDPSFNPKTNPHEHDQQHGNVIEEIEGLIKVYKDGHVERPHIVPCVATAVPPELGVTSRDVVIDKFTNIWSRFYVPKCHGNDNKLPLLVYFHGGGFCVGSAAWSCYHEFLAKLAAKAGCLIMSVNYRLVPEHPLPAAYEDGLKALLWLKQQALSQRGANNKWWSRQCDFSRIFLVGDSAGANIAHNVATRLCNIISDGPCDEQIIISSLIKPLTIKGTILLQPFFGGEARTSSEKYNMVKQPGSALSLAASDTYWRLALPCGANRDHPWCNPLKSASSLRAVWATMVCISEMDILKDRNLEFCCALDHNSNRAGKMKVECVVYKGVGHAFQVLDKSQLSKTRSQEMITHIKAFVNYN